MSFLDPWAPGVSKVDEVITANSHTGDVALCSDQLDISAKCQIANRDL